MPSDSHHDLASWQHGRKLILACAVQQGVQRTLASGRTSTFYVDMRKAAGDPLLLQLLGRQLLAIARSLDVAAIGGPATGGISLAASASLASLSDGGPPLPWFYVRPTAKAHGSRQSVEGILAGGGAVLLVEDVVTSGGSVLDAAHAVEAEGASIAGIAAVVDRSEGARDTIEAAGYTFRALYERADLEDADDQHHP